MSKRKAAAAPADVPRKRVARFSPAFSDDEADAAAPPLDLPTDSEDESLEDSDVPLNEDDEPIDEDDGPAFAQYMAESDMEDEGEASSEEEDQLEGLKDQLAAVPMGALLQARRSAQPSTSRKAAPGPLPPVPDEVPAAKKRPRASKSGRTVPRYANALTEEEEPAAPLPGFLTGANAAQPGVKKEKRERKEIHGRDTKHGPAVMSSKKAVGRARQVVEVAKVERRDPRFDTLSGNLDETRFRKTYGFLDDARTAELEELRQRVKAKSQASLTEAERERQRKALTRLESQAERRKREDREHEVLRAARHAEREKRAQGKKPYHLKRSEEKALLEAARVEDLTKSGKLAKSERKKEMKATQKERKHRPPPRKVV